MATALANPMKSPFHRKTPPAETVLSLRVKARLLELGITSAALSKATRLSVGAVDNILNGTNRSPKSRAHITDAVGEELWPGIKPQARTLPLRDEEKALLRSVFDLLAALGNELSSVSAQHAQADIRARAAALLTSEFVEAYRRFARIGGAAALIEIAPITAPFTAELLGAMGCQVSGGSGGKPFRIRVSK